MYRSITSNICCLYRCDVTIRSTFDSDYYLSNIGRIFHQQRNLNILLLQETISYTCPLYRQWRHSVYDLREIELDAKHRRIDEDLEMLIQREKAMSLQKQQSMPVNKKYIFLQSKPDQYQFHQPKAAAPAFTSAVFMPIEAVSPSLNSDTNSPAPPPALSQLRQSLSECSSHLSPSAEEPGIVGLCLDNTNRENDEDEEDDEYYQDDENGDNENENENSDDEDKSDEDEDEDENQEDSESDEDSGENTGSLAQRQNYRRSNRPAGRIPRSGQSSSNNNQRNAESKKDNQNSAGITATSSSPLDTVLTPYATALFNGMFGDEHSQPLSRRLSARQNGPTSPLLRLRKRTSQVGDTDDDEDTENLVQYRQVSKRNRTDA